jgi:multicomponent Na+:H+ antiporter subunit E
MQDKSLSFWRRHHGLIIQAFLLAGLWLLLSGKFEPIYFLWGAFSVALAIGLSHRLSNLPLDEKHEFGHPVIIFHRLIIYIFWLIGEILKSGITIAYVVLHPKMPIQPMLVRFRSMQPNVLTKVILGNSITLTPGTLTLDIIDDQFIVHAITMDTAQDLISGDMEARVAELYLKDCDEGLMCYDAEYYTEEQGEYKWKSFFSALH